MIEFVPRISFIHIGTIQTYEQEVSDFYFNFLRNDVDNRVWNV